VLKHLFLAGAVMLLACSGFDEVAEQVDDAFRLAEALNDPEAYATRVEEGCERGDPKDCSSLGTHYRTGGFGREQDYEQARVYLTKACDGGYAYGCQQLGNLLTRVYVDDLGQTHGPDYEQAHVYLTKGCEGGQGCHDLGVLYMYGRGVEVDPERAMELFERTCPEDANSCRYLGDYYRLGKDGVEKDPSTASAWYQKACDAGSTSSCGL